MTLRFIDTAIWTDPWFEKLSPDAKLIFIYSWSNDHMNAAGCTPISPKRIGLEVGINEARAKKALAALHPKVIYFQDFDILWAVKFLSKQTRAGTFLTKVAKDLEKMPDSIAATVFAAYDNLPIPYTPSVQTPDDLTVLSCTDSVPIPAPKNNHLLQLEEILGTCENGEATLLKAIFSIPKFPKSPEETLKYLNEKLAKYGHTIVESAIESFVDKKVGGEKLTDSPLGQLTTYIKNDAKWREEKGDDEPPWVKEARERRRLREEGKL